MSRSKCKVNVTSVKFINEDEANATINGLPRFALINAICPEEMIIYEAADTELNTPIFSYISDEEDGISKRLQDMYLGAEVIVMDS
jgi:hypothetical protein